MPKLRPGDTVCLTGLEVDKFNGMMGTVLSLPNKQGLLEVEVYPTNGHRRVMAVKSRNVAKKVDQEQLKLMQEEASAKCGNVLGGSAGAVLLLVGVIMFIINERKHVSALATQQGGLAATNASCTRAGQPPVGSPLFLSGCPVSGLRDFSTQTGLRGLQGNPQVMGLRLETNVQVYQWVENCAEKCTYSRGWVDEIRPVDQFRDQKAFVEFCAEDNLGRACRNTGPGFQGNTQEFLRSMSLKKLGMLTLYAPDARVGAYPLPSELANMIGTGKRVTPVWLGCLDPPCTDLQLWLWGNDTTYPRVSVLDRMLHVSKSSRPETYATGPGPKIGDARIGHVIYTSTVATVAAAHADNGTGGGLIVPWKQPIYDTGIIFQASDGVVPLHDLVDLAALPLFDGIDTARVVSIVLLFVGMILSLAFCQPKYLGYKPEDFGGYLSLFPTKPKRVYLWPFSVSGFGIVWAISVSGFLAACVWAPLSPTVCGVLFMVWVLASTVALCWGYHFRGYEEEKAPDIQFAEDIQHRDEVRRMSEEPEPEIDVHEEMIRMVETPRKGSVETAHHYILEPPPGMEPMDVASDLKRGDLEEGIARETRVALTKKQESDSGLQLQLSSTSHSLNSDSVDSAAISQSIYVVNQTNYMSSSDEEDDNYDWGEHLRAEPAELTRQPSEKMNPVEVTSNVLMFKGIGLGVAKQLSPDTPQILASGTATRKHMGTPQQQGLRRADLDNSFSPGVTSPTTPSAATPNFNFTSPKSSAASAATPKFKPKGVGASPEFTEFESPTTALHRASLGPVSYNRQPRQHGASPDLLLLTAGPSYTSQSPPKHVFDTGVSPTPPHPTHTAPVMPSLLKKAQPGVGGEGPKSFLAGLPGLKKKRKDDDNAPPPAGGRDGSAGLTRIV